MITCRDCGARSLVYIEEWNGYVYLWEHDEGSIANSRFTPILNSGQEVCPGCEEEMRYLFRTTAWRDDDVSDLPD